MFRSVAISADGSQIAAGHDSGKTILFNSSSSTPYWISDKGGFAVDFSGDGKYLVANEWSCCDVYLWNITSSTPVQTSTSKSQYAVSMSLDGYYYVTTYGNQLYLFNNTLSDGLYVVTTSPSDGSSAANPANLKWLSSYSK